MPYRASSSWCSATAEAKSSGVTSPRMTEYRSRFSSYTPTPLTISVGSSPWSMYLTTCLTVEKAEARHMARAMAASRQVERVFKMRFNSTLSTAPPPFPASPA